MIFTIPVLPKLTRCALSATIALALLSGTILSTFFTPVQADPVRNSRLGELIQRRLNVFLPARMIIGKANQFTVQGNPGDHVRILLSQDSSGFTTTDGQALRIGTEHETVEGTIPENGVLQLSVELPNEVSLVGHDLFVEALSSKSEDFSEPRVMALMDSSGRKTEENRLAITKPVTKRGSFIVPSVPGVPTQMMQQVSNYAELQREDDPRKKELITPSKDLGERDAFIDQNPFARRPGRFQQP